MVRTAALILMQAAFSGPAMLVIVKSNTVEFVQPFSTVARCEAAKGLLESKWREAAEAVAAQGYKRIGAPNTVRCIPG